MKRLSLPLVLLIFVSVSFAMPSETTLEKVRGGYRLTIKIPQAAIYETAVNDLLRHGTPIRKTFSRITIPGFAQNFDNIGGPELLRSSFKLAIEIHRMTFTLPKYEFYEVGSQIRKSSKGVVANIVEGYGRKNYKLDFLRFLHYSLSSNDETIVF